MTISTKRWLIFAVHRGCGGNLVDDPTKTYEYQSDEEYDGPVSHIPAIRCTKCGKEILGDAEIDWVDENRDVVDL